MTTYLSAAECIQFEDLRHRDPFVRETLIQVDRMLASRFFMGVQQHAKDMLRWLITKTLFGQADLIKEATFALAVFAESADSDPAETGKIRVAASDLRQRLTVYAEGEGQDDVIRIVIPLSTCVLEILDRRIAVAITEWLSHDQIPAPVPFAAWAASQR